MTPYANSVLADAPVGWWRLTETDPLDTAIDASGNGNDGSYNGSGETMAITGPLQGGDVSKGFTTAGNFWMYLTGTFARYFNGRTTLSLECWVQFTDAVSTQADFIGWDGDSFIVLNNESGTVDASVGQYNTNATNPSNDGLWHHVVMTCNGNVAGNTMTLFLYIDGVLVGSTLFSQPGGVLPTDTATPFAVGAGEFTDNNPVLPYPGVPYIGSIAEPAVYPQALSTPRVLAHYNAGVNGPPAPGTARAQSWFMGYDE